MTARLDRPEDGDTLDETLGILADEHLMAEMQQAQGDLDPGLGVELDGPPTRA